jgi:hypothetical protein
MNDALQELTSALAGQYRIERELGAAAYLAHDIKHDRVSTPRAARA